MNRKKFMCYKHSRSSALKIHSVRTLFSHKYC